MGWKRTGGWILGLCLAAASAEAAEPRLLMTFSTLTTHAALTAAQAALDRCQRSGATVAVAVVDRGGHALALLRHNLAGGHTVATALGKAATAVSFRLDTTALAESTEGGKGQSGVRQLPGVVAIGGGMVIRAKGAVVAGIGVSGAPGGDADDVCARAGIAAINEAIELE